MMKERKRSVPAAVKAVCLVLSVGCLMTACRQKPAEAADDETVSAAAITEQEAIESAAELIEDVFSVTVDMDRMQIEDHGEDEYTVYMEHEDEAIYEYAACVDKETGEILYLSRNDDDLTMTDEQREKAIAFDVLTASESEIQELNDACTPIVQALVERVFADGRTVTQTLFASIMSDSETDATQQVTISVRMSEGTCYAVTVVWPQLEVFSVTAFPLGWHSCFYGYQDPAEADEYPPLED